PLLVAHLALDAQRAFVAHLLQRLHELLDVHLALPERHLLAPGAGHGGPVGVLDVDAADVRSKHLHRSQWIALVVEEHVGGGEVDLEVGALQLVERAAEEIGRLLARLEGDGDALRLRERADLAEVSRKALRSGSPGSGMKPAWSIRSVRPRARTRSR